MIATTTALPVWALEISAVAAAISVVVNAISGVLSDWLTWERIRQMGHQQQKTHELTQQIAAHVGIEEER